MKIMSWSKVWFTYLKGTQFGCYDACDWGSRFVNPDWTAPQQITLNKMFLFSLFFFFLNDFKLLFLKELLIILWLFHCFMCLLLVFFAWNHSFVILVFSKTKKKQDSCMSVRQSNGSWFIFFFLAFYKRHSEPAREQPFLDYSGCMLTKSQFAISQLINIVLTSWWQSR